MNKHTIMSVFKVNPVYYKISTKLQSKHMTSNTGVILSLEWHPDVTFCVHYVLFLCYGSTQGPFF